MGKMQCFGTFSQSEPICPHFSAVFSMDMLIVLLGLDLLVHKGTAPAALGAPSVLALNPSNSSKWCREKSLILWSDGEPHLQVLCSWHALLTPKSCYSWDASPGAKSHRLMVGSPCGIQEHLLDLLVGAGSKLPWGEPALCLGYGLHGSPHGVSLPGLMEPPSSCLQVQYCVDSFMQCPLGLLSIAKWRGSNVGAGWCSQPKVCVLGCILLSPA